MFIVIISALLLFATPLFAISDQTARDFVKALVADSGELEKFVLPEPYIAGEPLRVDFEGTHSIR